jgi:hypothetical protein
MNGREDWGRSEEDLMRARGAVDEVLTSLGLAPAHFDENLRARVSRVLSFVKWWCCMATWQLQECWLRNALAFPF